MTHSGLDNFGAYQKALALFDLVVDDMALLQKDTRCYRLVSQQVGSADAICANIEEGYGRISRREYVRFLDFARGSARETQGRYSRMKHWLSPDVIAHRTALAGEIIAILTSTIKRLQMELPPGAEDTNHSMSVKEPSIEYESSPLTPDT